MSFKLKTLKPRIPTLQSRIASLPSPSRAPGYRIRGRARQEMRARHFREHPLCVECERRGLVTAATELDHVIPLSEGGTHDESNLAGLCRACHATKTARELRARYGR